MYEFRSLESTSFDEIYASYLKAFYDYPFQWSRDTLYKMVMRRGYLPELSFGAFYENELVSFTLNGIGSMNGIRSAYDTGTGTTELHRGKGLASRIFEYGIPFLIRAGIKQYILEVITDNDRAYSIYSKQGFTRTRTFECFRSNGNEWIFSAEEVEGIHLRNIDFSFQKEMEPMIDFTLSWQNNFQALTRYPNDFLILGAFRSDQLVGFGIIDPESGDVPILAVSSLERKKGIGSLILSRLKSMNRFETLKVVNIESEEHAILNFIKHCGLPKLVSQYEMIKTF